MKILEFKLGLLTWFTHLVGFPHLLGENWDRKEQNRRNTHGTLNEKTRQPGIHGQNTNAAGKWLDICVFIKFDSIYNA